MALEIWKWRFVWPLRIFSMSVGIRDLGPGYLPVSRTQRQFLIQIGAPAADYRTGEKAVGTSSLFSCRTGRTPLCGGHAPPGLRDSSRMRARSPRSLYTQVWTNLLSPPSSLVQQAARGESSSRAGTALAHASSTFGISPGA